MYYTEHKLKIKTWESVAIENQQESFVNILELPHTTCVKETLKNLLENFQAMLPVWF